MYEKDGVFRRGLPVRTVGEYPLGERRGRRQNSKMPGTTSHTILKQCLFSF